MTHPELVAEFINKNNKKIKNMLHSQYVCLYCKKRYENSSQQIKGHYSLFWLGLHKK